MDFKQKYKEAFERAKKLKETCDSLAVIGWCEYIFPELKESEDERIRKKLINFVKSRLAGFPQCEKYISWLEKQGEQKPCVNDNAKEMFIRALERVEEQNSKGYKLTDCDKNSWWEDFKTYTSEQNLANSAKTCKVEPKFKVGDWITDKQGLVHQIENVVENVTNHTFGYDIVGGGYFNDNSDVRLWTIEDAKKGDVLVASDGSIFIYKYQRDNGVVHYIAVTPYDVLEINENDYSWEGKDVCHPATKDEQTVLFERMKEAGYEWDAMKKQLKKL